MLIPLILAGFFLGTAVILLIVCLRQRGRIRQLVLDTTILSRICDLSTDGASSLVLTPEGKFSRDWARAPILDTLGIDFASINDFESFSKIIFPEDLPRFRGELAKLMSGQQVSCVFRVRAADGGIRWLRDTVSPERDPASGRVVRLISVVQDITGEQEILDVLRRVERRYDEMFRNSSDSIFIVRLDQDGNFVYENFNPRHRFVTGIPEDRLVGRTPHECLPPEIADHVVEHYSRCITADGPVSYEEALDLPSGYQVALTLLVPIRGEDGRIESIVGFSRVITQRKQAEEELRKGREKYRNIFEESPMGIFQSTLDGRFLSVNPEMCRIFGYPDPESMIKEITDIPTQVYASAQDREGLLRRVLESPVSLAEELVFLKRDGTRFPVRLIIKAVRGPDGTVHHLFGHIEDMTEIRRIEDERNRLEEQLRHAQRVEAIGRLAGAVAHDFNNLLSPILGYAELLLATPETVPWAAELTMIRDTASRAAGITRQLLTFSRKQPVHLVDTDACAIVTNFLPLLKQTGGDDVDFVVQLPENGAPVCADVLQIEQVLLNLTLNAVDAMQGKGTIGIEIGRTESFVSMTVSDTGCGFSEETRKQMFEPFYTTKRPGTGTGLGLPIVASIIEQHGGHVEVESVQGEGSRFTIFLPVGTCEKGRADTRDSGEDVRPDRANETIIVIEDEEMVVNLVREILTRNGYRVIACQDASDALERLQNGLAVDCVITDVMMPGMSGDILAQKIREILPDVPLLFMSGYADTLLVERGQLTANAEFIQKPFAVRELLRTVTAMLDARRRDAGDSGRSRSMA
ncbi:MAG TPA: PAS domain S-box protein [Spirochaetota bacterium]|nr:PAS domain S-box protein [Spirochaetota bacterium]